MYRNIDAVQFVASAVLPPHTHAYRLADGQFTSYLELLCSFTLSPHQSRFYYYLCSKNMSLQEQYFTTIIPGRTSCL